MNNLQEVNPEYVYMTIPAEYVCTYHKILVLLAEYGVDMLNDCQAGCTARNKCIIDCFNMFNAAIAARKLKQDKVAETIIKYINGQLKLIYKDENINNIIFPIDEHGYLQAIVSCTKNPKFYIDAESGQLIQNGKSLDKFELDEKDIDKE